MSKQTAVEFLIQQIELALKLNKVQINFEYRIKTINPVYEIARKMEREQRERMYSEEEVLELLHKRMTYTLGEEYKEETTLEWFEQFKKTKGGEQ